MQVNANILTHPETGYFVTFLAANEAACVLFSNKDTRTAGKFEQGAIDYARQLYADLRVMGFVPLTR